MTTGGSSTEGTRISASPSAIAVLSVIQLQDLTHRRSAVSRCCHADRRSDSEPTNTLPSSMRWQAASIADSGVGAITMWSDPPFRYWTCHVMRGEVGRFVRVHNRGILLTLSADVLRQVMALANRRIGTDRR